MGRPAKTLRKKKRWKAIRSGQTCTGIREKTKFGALETKRGENLKGRREGEAKMARAFALYQKGYRESSRRSVGQLEGKHGPLLE